MKVVCHELAAASNDPEGSLMDELLKVADKLVSCLATKQELSVISNGIFSEGDFSSGLTEGSGGLLIMASISFLCIPQLKVFLKILDSVSANTSAFLAKTSSTLPLLRRQFLHHWELVQLKALPAALGVNATKD
ncbi:unnamed protein product [Lactuca saligna]|uniref:Uncharacterized protein n=1 Tax=Lactuca saligna TaxID=75948 RepID=A0AA35VI18_LACSI|nr:unnamed protein product [Lactuca saligna]